MQYFTSRIDKKLTATSFHSFTAFDFVQRNGGFETHPCDHRGPGSVVGIATGYGLDGPGIEFRLGARSSAPVQTGPGAHPASFTTGTGSFPGVKSGRGVTLTRHPLLVSWSRKGRAILLLPAMGRTTCTEPQCLYKGALYLFYLVIITSVLLYVILKT